VLTAPMGGRPLQYESNRLFLKNWQLSTFIVAWYILDREMLNC
jgi:hypothetical protein